MDNLNPETISLYSPEELRLQRIGARLLIMEMLETMRNDWNGYGIKLWAERKLEELDGKPDDSQLHF